MPADTPTALIALVAAELSAIAPTGFDLNDSARHEAPRRFVWVPQDSPLTGPKKTGSGHPLDSIGLRFVVECWGHSFDDAFYLVACLLTAIQKAWGGRNYVASTVQPWAQRVMHEGYVMGVEVELQLHLLAVDLTNPLAPPGKAHVFEAPPADGPALPDDAQPAYGPTTTEITAVAEATPTTGTPGDGVLDSQES